MKKKSNCLNVFKDVTKDFTSEIFGSMGIGSKKDKYYSKDSQNEMRRVLIGKKKGM